MADEWVSVRARLAKDGKTISIVNWLAKHQPFQQWLGVPVEKLNRNALVSVTLKALIEVWAVGNSRGVPDGDDVILLYTDFEAIDEIAEVPGFALAMEFVHWAHLDENDGVSSVRLPNFSEYNTPAENRTEKEKRARELNRERQKRFRDRRNASNAHVTANNAPTVEKSREQNRRATTAVAGMDRGMQGGKGQDGNSSAGNPDPVRARENGRVGPKPQRRFADRPVPVGFQQLLDSIVGILDLGELTDEWRDQIGFLAKMAYADAAGFTWPPDKAGNQRDLWQLLEAARIARRRRRNPIRNSAGYLTRLLKEDLTPEAWQEFEDAYPSGAHCQWLLAQLGSGAITEGGG
jgi:hypothetical protein